MTNLQPFEELVEAAKAEIVERHPELSPDNRGIDPSIIINAQAKQLLKANKNAEGHIANHRRDQSKIVELKAENQDLRVKLAKSQAESTNRYAALHLYINWTDIIVAERDARIAALESVLKPLISYSKGFLKRFEIVMRTMGSRNNEFTTRTMRENIATAETLLEGEVK